MLETFPIPYDADAVAWALIGLTVALLGAARIHSSDRWWCPELAWFWNPIRRVVAPPLDTVLERVPFAFGKSTVYEREIVATGLDVTIEDLREDLADAGYEVQPLASLARFDPSSDLEIAADVERGSYARYYGDRVGGEYTSGLPDWLVRKRQVHIRPFGDDGELTITAHAEYSAWNPVYALPHLLGIGLDPQRGVEKAADDLGIDLEASNERDDDL